MTTRRVLVESCVDSLEAACASEAAGADRVELCGPSRTGVTPSTALLHAVCAAVRIPVHVMIRPREGDFVYTDDEFADMCTAIDAAKEAGAAAAVFGVLHSDGALDVARMQLLVERARPMRTACHRAFDATPVADAALAELCQLGVDIVLTSGHAATAAQGIDTLARHAEREGGTIEVMAGGSVRADTVRDIVDRTRVPAVHARGLDPAVITELVATLRSPR